MKNTNYIAKKPDKSGFIHYTDEEHNVWSKLYCRQIKIIENKACDEFQTGVAKLKLSADKIPQCRDISAQLRPLTGWQVKPVDALISFQKFFHTLANKTFPVASFIRRPDEIDYLKEPDIFHEVFGHCTMLTDPRLADFTHTIGKIGVQLNQQDRVLLARLYWFTVEFGLVNTQQGLRIYGAGILSSKEETLYALNSNKPTRLNFDLLRVLQTLYRYDEKQLTYFILNNMNDLYALADIEKLKLAFVQVQQLKPFQRKKVCNEQDIRSC